MMLMMGCGHSANAKDGNGNPVCVICIGIDPNAATPVASPDLTGRMARCTYDGRVRSNPKTRNNHKNGHGPVQSSTDLPFFMYHSNQSEDEYYCGCFGWN